MPSPSSPNSRPTPTTSRHQPVASHWALRRLRPDRQRRGKRDPLRLPNPAATQAPQFAGTLLPGGGARGIANEQDGWCGNPHGGLGFTPGRRDTPHVDPAGTTSSAPGLPAPLPATASRTRNLTRAAAAHTNSRLTHPPLLPRRHHPAAIRLLPPRRHHHPRHGHPLRRRHHGLRRHHRGSASTMKSLATRNTYPASYTATLTRRHVGWQHAKPRWH